MYVHARYSLRRNIAEWDVLPMFPMQNYDKPTNVSVTEWRRTQLLRYLKHHPETKPKEIMIQFSRHSPHPWPDVAQSNMSRILNSLKSRKSYSQVTHTYTLSVDRSVTEETIISIATRWQRIPPLGVQILKWRKIKIRRYLKEFLDHGPSKIILQLRSHRPNPQLEVTANWMGRFVRKQRSKAMYDVDNLQLALSLTNPVGVCNVEPRAIRQNNNIPLGYTVRPQRRKQLSLYIDQFPSHGPSKIMQQIQSHSPNPWPTVTQNALQNAVIRARRML